MSGQPYTDADVQLVRRAIFDAQASNLRSYARAVLDALAAAGRLLPVEGERLWAVGHPSTKHVIPARDEADARAAAAALGGGHRVVSRFVSTWEGSE